MQTIGLLAVILFLAAVSGHLSARLGLPTVVGQLLLGVIVGPILHWIQQTPLLTLGADIGLILLMFLAGANSDIQLLRKFWRPGVIVAVSGVVVPVVIMTALGFAGHLSGQESIYLGVIFSATSVSISVDVLREFSQLNSAEGTTILAAAVVDDILAMIALGLLTAFTSTQSVNLALILLLQVGYFVLLWFSRPLIKKILFLSQRLLVSANVTIVALVIVFALAATAEWAHLSSAIGAFFAGIIIKQTPHGSEITTQLQTLGYALFIPLFFVNIGLQMRLNGIKQSWGFFVILTIAAVLTKLVGAGLGAKGAGFSRKSSLVIGMGMVSRGEMALVVAQIGHAQHLLNSNDYSLVIAVIIATTILSPLLLKWALNLSQADN